MYDNHTGEFLDEDALHERYDAYLDGIHDEVFGIEPSRILKTCDPIAYRVGYSDWESGEVEDGSLTEDDPNDGADDEQDED